MSERLQDFELSRNKKTQADAQTYNTRQRLFNLPLTEYDHLSRTARDFEPYRNLWLTTDDWLKSHKLEAYSSEVAAFDDIGLLDRSVVGVDVQSAAPADAAISGSLEKGNEVSVASVAPVGLILLRYLE